MEKEEKGLFYRLMDFWREKVGSGETERIGFPMEREATGIPLVEMGTVAALAQKETRQVFGEAEYLPREKEQKKADPEVWEDRSPRMAEWMKTDVISEKEILQKEIDVPSFREEKRKNILLAAAEQEQKKGFSEEAEGTETEPPRKEERQTEQAVDIEALMQKITKKLWEERESSGRRLR